MSPFISIIIPFYGAADKVLLQRCLDSIHRQGMEEGSYEVIVADDAGKGLGGARNNGIRQATGRYLMFVDADDYLFPDISYCFSYLKEYEPDICSFQMYKVREAGVRPRSFAYHWETYVSGAEYMSRNNFTGNACRHFFRRRFIEEYALSFAESCYHEDEDFMAKAYCFAGTTLITDYPVYAYFMHPGSITHQSSSEVRLRRMADFFEMLCRVKNQLFALEDAEGVDATKVIALKRRLNFLTIDYIRLLLRNRSPHLGSRIRALKRAGLLPLPRPVYTWKYGIVRIIVNSIVWL